MSPDVDLTASRPIGFLLVCAVAVAFYIAMIASNSVAGGGEAAFGNAMQSLFSVVGLWTVLAVLLLIGGIMGVMPRWAALAWIPILLLSCVAAFVAADMVSRRHSWAVAFQLALPAPIVIYALWARLPGLRQRFDERTASIACLGSTIALSLAALMLAYFI